MKPYKYLAFAITQMSFSAQQLNSALQEDSKTIQEFEQNQKQLKIINKNQHPFKRFIGSGYKKN